MPLTAKENFRMGFLMRCAEEGCSIEEIQDRVKVAGVLTTLSQDDRFVKEAGYLSNLLGKTLGGMGAWALSAPATAAMLGVGGAGLLGAGAGYGAAKLQDESVDPEEAKRHELIAAYRAQAERVRRKTQQTNYRQPTPKAPELFSGEDHGF